MPVDKEDEYGRAGQDYGPWQLGILGDRRRGEAFVTDAEGNEFRSEQRTIAPCWTGGSKTKPFCDGTYSKIGFREAERAVREKEE